MTKTERNIRNAATLLLVTIGAAGCNQISATDAQATAAAARQTGIAEGLSATRAIPTADRLATLESLYKTPQVIVVTATPEPAKPTQASVATKAATAPAIKKYPGAVDVLVPATDWTDMARGNLVIPEAIAVRPSKPYEAEIKVDVTKVYQLRTDFDDSQPSTWRDGSLIYKFHVPAGLQPHFMGTQGDTGTQLCWANEEEGNMVWMKTEKGNGTSAVVRFEKTGKNPERLKLCP